MDSFRFKQFVIHQQDCAMKVGTDGVLLGAWASCHGAKHVLDIGCGTGVIALMIAQRYPQALVDGIELVGKAATQACNNVAQSPFAERVKIEQADVRHWQGNYDSIVCNPPFFSEHTISVSAERVLARSAHSLPFADLWQCVDRLLVPGGTFNVILPVNEYIHFQSYAISLGYSIRHSMEICTTSQKPPTRLLLCYTKGNCQMQARERLILHMYPGKRSEGFELLTKDFYL